MVIVVRDEKVAYCLLFLSVFALNIRQFQAAVGVPVVGFDVHLSLISQHGGVALYAVGNGKVNRRTVLPARRIERTSAHKYTHHVVNTVGIGMLYPRMGAVIMLSMLAHMALTVGV